MHSSGSPHPAPSPARWFPRGPGEPAEKGRVVDYGRLLLGAVVVTIGALFLLESAGVLDAGRAIDRFWPLVIVAAGTLTFLERPPSVFRATLLTAVGLVLLMFTTDLVDEDAWAYLWPAALMLVGVAIVARWSGRMIRTGRDGEDVVRTTAAFGGSEIASAADRFRGAWLTAIFGGVTLDLRDAVPAPEGASVNATVAFGGIDILVPRGWRITTRSTPIFGGLGDKTEHGATIAPDAPTLHVDAVMIFGGVEIKHEK